jgi:hypothetical protein
MALSVPLGFKSGSVEELYIEIVARDKVFQTLQLKFEERALKEWCHRTKYEDKY